MTKKQKIENWWDEHPLMKNFYVPLVGTATFLVTIIDAFTGAKGR